MKKNGEYVGVDEKFIPEEEKYVDESLLGDKEKSRKMAKKIGKGYLVSFIIMMCLPITMMIFAGIQIFNINNKFYDVKKNLDIDIKANKYTFSHLSGTQCGFYLRDYLDDIITNNKLDAYTTITVVYNGKSATTEEEILSIKNQIPNTSSDDYEVSVDYADSRGQVINKVTIKDIK